MVIYGTYYDAKHDKFVGVPLMIFTFNNLNKMEALFSYSF